MPSHVNALVLLDLTMQQSCEADGGGAACTAGHLLHWLYWIAGILAIVLIIVVLLAVRLWRKNKDADPHS